MLPRAGVTQTLARFVAETRWETLPDPVRHEAKRALLNFFAVTIAGCRTEPVEIALDTKQPTVRDAAAPAASVEFGNLPLAWVTRTYVRCSMGSSPTWAE